MTKLKTLFTTVLLTVCLLNISTVQASPIQDQTIEELLTLSDVKGMIQEANKELRPMFDQQAQSIVKSTLKVETLNQNQLDAATKISVIMSKLTSDITESPKYYDMLKTSYKKIFTEEEARANIAFLKTPLGQSINKKSAKLMSDVMKQSQNMAAEAMQDKKIQSKLLSDIEKIITPLLKEKQ